MGMLKSSGLQEKSKRHNFSKLIYENKNTGIKTEKIGFYENSIFSCYKQTSPLGVYSYAVG